MASPLGYTTRSKVEKYLNRTFSEVDTTEFNDYISQAETYVNNYLGYNAQTTSSGILQESITREKSVGKIDQFGNLVIDLMHPPIAFDVNNNPMVSLLEFNLGGIRIPLQLTDGSTNSMNTLIEVSENRRKVYYPSLYFYPAISTVTPTAKMNLYNLRDVRFWVDISYIGGYSTVPGDITSATNILVANLILNRDNPNFAQSYTQGSFTVNYGNLSSDPAIKQANVLLQPYVRYTW